MGIGKSTSSVGLQKRSQAGMIFRVALYKFPNFNSLIT